MVLQLVPAHFRAGVVVPYTDRAVLPARRQLPRLRAECHRDYLTVVARAPGDQLAPHIDVPDLELHGWFRLPGIPGRRRQAPAIRRECKARDRAVMSTQSNEL